VEQGFLFHRVHGQGGHPVGDQGEQGAVVIDAHAASAPVAVGQHVILVNGPAHIAHEFLHAFAPY
jgi:hypothetical protein